MKHFLFLLTVTLFSTAVFAQVAASSASAAPDPTAGATEKSVAESLDWMMGEWEGEGVSPGEREFIGMMSVTRELDDNAVLIRRESMNKAGGPSGGRKEIMVIEVDGATRKIVMTVHASNHFIGIYSGEMKGSNEIVFTLVTSQPGYVNRRSFKLLGDGGVSFTIEGASPGKEVSRQVEINFRKKS